MLGCSEVKYIEFVTPHVRLLALSKRHIMNIIMWAHFLQEETAHIIIFMCIQCQRTNSTPSQANLHPQPLMTS